MSRPSPSLVFVGERDHDDVWMLDYRGAHRFVVRAGRNDTLTVTALTQAEKPDSSYEQPSYPEESVRQRPTDEERLLIFFDEVAHVTPEQWERIRAAVDAHEPKLHTLVVRGAAPSQGSSEQHLLDVECVRCRERYEHRPPVGGLITLTTSFLRDLELEHQRRVG